VLCAWDRAKRAKEGFLLIGSPSSHHHGGTGPCLEEARVRVEDDSTAAARLRDEVREFCPIPQGSRVASSVREAQSVLLSGRYVAVRDITPADVYRDNSLDLDTRLDSFFNAWPMFSEGMQHQNLRRLTRQIVASGSERALSQVDDALALALPSSHDERPAPEAFEWVRRVAQPVSAAVVDGLVGRLVHSAPLEEILALGAAMMLKLSGREEGPLREQAALAAGVRLADLADRHRATIDAELDTADLSSELIGGALAQVVTGALDPLQAAVAAVPLFPGGCASDAIRGATPFRFVKRIDASTDDGAAIRVPLAWPGTAGIPFGLGPHRCTAAALTEKVVARVVYRVAEVADHGLVVTSGAVLPASFLRFEDVWVRCR
jgi:hypothetical protein